MGKLILNNGQQTKEEWVNMGGLERTLAIIQWVGIIFTVICVVNLFVGFFPKAFLILAIALWIAPMIAGSNIEERSENSHHYGNFREYVKVKFLPKVPKSITFIEDESELKEGVAMVIGGLNLIGDKGYICPTVTLLMGDESKLWGWSLCIGNPDQKEEALYFFNTSEKTHRGTELPNTMTYFQAKVDAKLLRENADRKSLEEVVAYVLPHICDDGPPPPHPSDEVFKQKQREESDGRSSAQAKELLGQVNILLDKVIEDFAGRECSYWDLHKEINKMLHESGLFYAWKSNPADPDYNPHLGIIEKQIGKKTLRVNIGLPSDSFFKVCAVIQLTPHED